MGSNLQALRRRPERFPCATDTYKSATVYDYIIYNNRLFVRKPLSCALYDADCLVSTVYRILMTLVRWYEGMYELNFND